MVYYPLGPGSDVSGSTQDTWDFPFDKVRKTDPNVRESGVVSFTGTVRSGHVVRRKGPPTTVDGRKWSPPRDYVRSASILTHNGGVDTYEEYHAGRDWIVSKRGPAYCRSLSDYSPTWTYFESEMSPDQYAFLNTQLLIKMGRRQVNYGESLAEGRKTFDHLARTTSTLVRAVLAARKGQWHRVPRILGVSRKRVLTGKTTAERWLEYQYGWLPLMGDIYDTYGLFKKGLSSGPQLMSAVKNSKEVIDRVNWSDFTRAHERIEVQLRAKAFYKISNSTLSQFNQLGLINPLEVAWAVVPFSFVVDWFLPVGDVLEAFSGRIGVTFVGGFYGRRCTYVCDSKNNFRSANLILKSSTWVARKRGFSYRRKTMASLPWPSPYMKSPFSTTHAISALALVRQLWR